MQKNNLNYTLTNPVGSQAVLVALPCDESEIQYICRNLDLQNTTDTEVVVTECTDLNLAPYLQGKSVGLEELNYLEKRLDSFSPDEMKIFYAAAQATKVETGRDLINLSYNLHCYSLIDNTKDLQTLGRSLYLHEAISAPTETLNQLDGEKYLEKLMQSTTPWATNQGVLFPNKNQSETVYNTRCLPAYSSGTGPIEVILTKEHPDHGTLCEILALPHWETGLNKLAERMGVKSLDEIKVENIIFHNGLATQIIDGIDLSGIESADNLGLLNEAAEFFKLSFEEQGYHALFFKHHLQVDSLNDLCEILSGVQTEELEFVENIVTVEDYGYYLVCENEETKIDTDIATFVDYEKYGESQLYDKTYVAIDKGLVIYHGESQGMEVMLELLKENEMEQPPMTGMT